MSLGLLVAQVQSLYPGAFDGGRIPWPAFWLLVEHMEPVVALHKLIAADGALAGAGVALAGKSALPMMDTLERQARDAATG